MKRFLRMAASAAFVLLLSACARHKIIPDDTLAQIFHDAFLTNAYIGSEGVKTDSLRIYEPIFARYGYTTDDVHYTIGNFSKRKSARLGDVVERAIEMLEREGKIYNQEVAVLDTIDNVARRTFTQSNNNSATTHGACGKMALSVTPGAAAATRHKADPPDAAPEVSPKVPLSNTAV